MTQMPGETLVGQELETQSRTLSEGEFALLTTLSWDVSPFHSDRLYAQDLGFKDRILEGPLLLSLSIGLEVTAGIMDMINGAGIRVIAMKEIENVEFISPVYPGDNLRVRSKFLEVLPTHKDGRWGMRLQTEAYSTDLLTMRAVRRFIFEES